MIDVLIIGQGLAGSLLAWRLHKAGKTLLIVDNGQKHSASKIAAGLVNPLAGRRLVLQANTEQILKNAQALYRDIEQQLNFRFYHPSDMLRILNHPEQKVALEKKLLGNYEHWIGEHSLSPHPDFPQSQAWIMQKQCAWLELDKMLQTIRHYFQQQSSYLEEKVDSQDIQINDDCVQWKHIKARQVVFCDGAQITHNHWFKDLPLQPAKGEIIDFTSALPPKLPHIINNGFWLLQKPDNSFRLGATHQWKYPDDLPTAEALQQLEQKIGELLGSDDITITQHQAALRPASRDKLPWIGSHPEHPLLKLCNGLGGRGGFFAPTASLHLSQHICHQTALPDEWNVQRFYATR